MNWKIERGALGVDFLIRCTSLISGIRCTFLWLKGGESIVTKFLFIKPPFQSMPMNLPRRLNPNWRNQQNLQPNWIELIHHDYEAAEINTTAGTIN
jgi:hypothetical protein